MPDEDSQCTACAVAGSPMKSENDLVVLGKPPDKEISILADDGGEYVYSFKEYFSDTDGSLYDEGDFEGEYEYGETDDDIENERRNERRSEDGEYIKGIQAGYDPESNRCKDKNGRYIKCDE